MADTVALDSAFTIEVGLVFVYVCVAQPILLLAFSVILISAVKPFLSRLCYVFSPFNESLHCKE